MNRHAKAIVASSAMLLTLALGATFAGAVAPGVSIEDASEVGASVARVKGSVDSQDQLTSWRFQYITDAQYEENVNVLLVPGFEGATDGPSGSLENGVDDISRKLTNLSPGTTYHLRLLAENGDGPSEAVASTFTTKGIAAPILSDVEATDVAFIGATAKGKVELASSDPAERPYSCRFEYIPAAQYDQNLSESLSGFEGASAQGCLTEPISAGVNEVEAELQLAHATEYRLRLVAESQAGSSSEEAPGTFTTGTVTAPSASAEDASAITSSSAHFSGEVTTGNADPGFDSECRFDYVRDAQFQQGGFDAAASIACDPDPVKGPGPVEVQADAQLEPSTTYHLRLRATNPGGSATDEASSFTTEGIAPEIADNPTFDPTSTTATFATRLNPHNAPLTECKFLYGIGAPSGHEIPCEDPPSGNEFQIVMAKVSGLTPDTEYSYKLVVETAAGSAEGPLQSFPTFPEPQPEGPCPNQAIREAQASSAPDCRAYEKVTPDDKNGADAPASRGISVRASSDGSGVVYGSRAGFADTVGSAAVGFTTYLARRGPEGWSSRGITPTPSHHASMAFTSGTVFLGLSDDLSRAVLTAYDLPGVDGDIVEEQNLYSIDTATRSMQAISEPLTPLTRYLAFIDKPPLGISGDSRHVAFSSLGPFGSSFLEEAAPGVENTYEWDNGVLRLAGVLPDGSVPSEGSTLPKYGDSYHDVVSNDGSRVTFFSPPESSQRQLYLRRDHSNTVWVSESEATTPVEKAEEVVLQWVSPDASHLLFTTTSRLLDEDDNDGPDLYLYTDGPDPTSESNLAMISQDGDVVLAAVGDTPVLGASDDANRIYFYLSSGVLRFWEENEIRTVTTRLGPGGATTDFEEPSGYGVATARTPGLSRVSPNGRHLAFLSNGMIDSGHGLTGQLTGDQKTQMYVYDAGADTLACASCRRGETTTANTTVFVEETLTKFVSEPEGFRTRFLSADGSRLFFSTKEALLPEDTNGTGDAYMYETGTGELVLISPGNRPGGAWFADATPSGDDVFLATRDQLVKADTDKLIDLYDARVGGGFPEPPSAPASCVGESCHSLHVAPPGVASPGTSSFSGPRNQQCRKKLRGRKKPPPRCGRPRKTSQHRNAGKNKKRITSTKQGGNR